MSTPKQAEEKKDFYFTFDIRGQATAHVKANSIEEACEKLKNDSDIEFNLDEWDVEYPNFFEEMDADDLSRYATWDDKQ